MPRLKSKAARFYPAWEMIYDSTGAITGRNRTLVKPPEGYEYDKKRVGVIIRTIPKGRKAKNQLK